MWRQFALSFIPLFVAVDALGNLPFFLSLTSGMILKQRRAVVNESVSVACFLAILFMLAGKWVLKVLGISVADFKIAGGILLLIISVTLLLPGKSKFANLPGSQENVGVFPLATPLITGPAVLTITLILLDKFGFLMTFISIVLNMLIVWVVFICSRGIFRLLGQAGSRAFSKISEILLAAIAIMLIRQGITEALILMR